MLTEQDRCRFLAYIDPTGDEDCWPWLSTVTRSGYGRFHVGKRRFTASRVALEIHIGRDLLPGEVACHVCDNKLCCNPNHLFVGTQSENMLDCSRKGRLYRPNGAHEGEGNPRAKLSEAQVAAIRAARGKQLQRETAAEFGVSRSLVSMIQSGNRWLSDAVGEADAPNQPIEGRPQP